MKTLLGKNLVSSIAFSIDTNANPAHTIHTISIKLFVIPNEIYLIKIVTWIVWFFNKGWSKAGCLLISTQSIISPSGLCIKYILSTHRLKLIWILSLVIKLHCYITWDLWRHHNPQKRMTLLRLKQKIQYRTQTCYMKWLITSMDLRAGLLRRFNCCWTCSFCFLLNMVLVFLFPTDDIGMRKNKQKVISTTLDNLLLLPQGRAMSD